MIKPKKLTDKKYPAFIRDNSVIKKCSKITKSFEEVGLPDYSEEYTHACGTTIEKFVTTLKTLLARFPNVWEKFFYYGGYGAASNNDVRRSELNKLITKITTSSIKKGNDLILPCKIQIPSYYRAKTVTYEKGSSLITLLNAICQDMEEVVYDTKVLRPFINLINHAVDLELSWNKKLKIVFSTHPWDIATMSMRGISSCQAWGKRQSPCLIGSIIDPNMGVIFITDGVPHKKLGDRMLARAVVRLTMPNKKIDAKGCYVSVTPAESKKRSIYAENAYASYASGPTQSEVFLKIFTKALNNKASDGGTDKLLLPATKAIKYFHGIPLTPQVKKTPEKYRSYRDGGLMYIPMIS